MTFSRRISVAIAICLASFANAVAITGPQGGVDTTNGQRPFRQEFSTFKNSGPAFDLYILSLQQFQQQNQSALLSYYQVGGIHGHPYISWDGVQGPYQAGYCTHSSILFPSWHRPYMALFEQILWNNAQQIAAKYPTPQRRQYQSAATTFRIPYWDWAFNTTMPDPVNDPTIRVNSPHGVVNIANPLYSYTFHPQPSAADFPPSDGMITEYHTTVRYPSSSGQSQPELANQQLQANAQAIQDATYQLIADQSNYAPFSNTGYTNDRGEFYNSLENMHNAIHSLVGHGGHMSHIPYSAFDPIFWLHHANVDRLFAIWQAIYPNSYTTAEVDIEGTFTNAPGETEDVNTPLTPFHSDGLGTLYTSATVRLTRPFGYTYPEVADWGVNATQLSSNARTAVNNLYNPSGSISTRSLFAKRDNHTALYKHTNVTEEEYHYYINIRVPKAALSRPFFIHFFLGPVPSSPLDWPFASTLIASQSILYYPPAIIPTPNTTKTAKSTNPNPTPPLLTYAQIPLIHALLSFLPLLSLSPPPKTNLSTMNNTLPSSSSLNDTNNTIVPLLQKHLSWKVQDFQDRAVLTEEVQGLKVFVVGKAGFPNYGEYRILRGATGGMVGGEGF